MTLTSSEIRVAGTGEIFVAPVGTTAPTDSTTALNAAFIGLGYTTENGVTIKRSTDREAINAWQSTTPLRYVYNGVDLSVGAEFLQSNKNTIKLFLGSGDFSGTGGNYKADVPTVPSQDARALVVQFDDGTIHRRLYIPKCEVSEVGDSAVTRNAAQTYALTFAALTPTSGTVLATWFTDDSAFA